MNRFASFQEFLTTQSAQIPLFSFTVNLFLAAFLAFLLGRVYIRYGNALSNRRRFASNFIMLAVTTTLIITVVKSSLALSLGLVGALSIVRFRAAIKEPEELAYLFLAISIGLGLGASQQLVTIVGFAVAVAVIRLVSVAKTQEEQNVFINIAGEHNPHRIELSDVVNTLTKYCSSVNLRRLDTSKESFEASFLVDIDDFEKLNQTKEELLKLSEAVRVTVLDNRGVI